MNDASPAADHRVAIFRQISHWPLSLLGTVLPGRWHRHEAWRLVSYPLTLLGDDAVERRQWAVQEFNYFHDTVQQLLHDPAKKAYTLYRRDCRVRLPKGTGSPTGFRSLI